MRRHGFDQLELRDQSRAIMSLLEPGIQRCRDPLHKGDMLHQGSIECVPRKLPRLDDGVHGKQLTINQRPRT